VSNAADTFVLQARGLRKDYGTGEGLVRSVDGVDLDIRAGETVAVMPPAGAESVTWVGSAMRDGSLRSERGRGPGASRGATEDLDSGF
jgi:predicted ABC-type transport system involved in lysophospholipase L1 biosynthesis ATPase subunit